LDRFIGTASEQTHHPGYKTQNWPGFNKTPKAELVWRFNWQTRREVEITLYEYINGFYNPRRKHSALG
jgi:hypothetical protein